MRQRYAKLLGDGSYSPDKVFAISSALDRTINSVSLVLAALFPPKNEQIWNENLLWQPIPVFIIPYSTDFMIIAEHACARYQKLLQEYEKSPEIQSLIIENRDLFEYLERYAGQPIRTMEHLKDIHNVLEVEYSMNKT